MGDVRRQAVVVAGAVVVALVGACSDAWEKDTTAGQIVAVISGGSDAVTLVSATHFTGTNLPYANPFATPASIAARDSFLLVPVATGDSIVVTRLLVSGAVSSQVIRLKSGAQASGIAVEDDSLAWVAEPGLNRAQQINYLTFDTTSRTPAADRPSAAVGAAGRVCVINANAVNNVPAGAIAVTGRLSNYAPPATQTIPLTRTD